MPTAKLIASGRVQGVFYRASTRDQALALGLAGYAKNLPDGRVEVLATGTAAALDALERWMRQGPPAAKVDTVVREDIAEQALHGFHTR